MASGSEVDLRALFEQKLAAAKALQEANRAFAQDLADGAVRVVRHDEGDIAFYRQGGKLREVPVEVLDYRTPPQDAGPTLP